jgi:hypothetical protein
MPKVFKPGWEYIYSEILKQELAIHIKTGRVYCEDGTQYEPGEIILMDKARAKINPEVHQVKSIFNGTIVEFKEIEIY